MSRPLAIAALPLLPLLLGACSEGLLLKPPSELELSSDPAGAEVLVMGEVVGSTPLQIPVAALYPNQFAPEKSELYGRVVVRKSGCQEAVHTISSRMLEKGLNVTLECGDPAQGTPLVQTPPTPQGIAQRLKTLDTLLEQGVIEPQEHAAQRARILGEL